jgi:hypothetical protein
LLRRVLLSSGLDPSVTVSGSYDLVWEVLQISLSSLIVESSSDKSFTGENSVFRISYGLSIIINIVTKQKGVVGRFSNAPHVKLHFWVLTYLLAGIPTSLWLLSAKATVEGVVL